MHLQLAELGHFPVVGGLYGSFGNKSMAVGETLVDDFQVRNMTPAQRKQHYRAKWQKKLVDLSIRISSNPNDIQAYKSRFRIHGLLDDQRGMRADLDQLIILEPNNQSHYLLRMGLYTQSKEARRAKVIRWRFRRCGSGC